MRVSGFSERSTIQPLREVEHIKLLTRSLHQDVAMWIHRPLLLIQRRLPRLAPCLICARMMTHLGFSAMELQLEELFLEPVLALTSLIHPFLAQEHLP